MRNFAGQAPLWRISDPRSFSRRGPTLVLCLDCELFLRHGRKGDEASIVRNVKGRVGVGR